MSKRFFGVSLVLVGILAFHLMGSQAETPPTWISEIPHKIYDIPVVCNGHSIILGGLKSKKIYNLYQVTHTGQITKSVDLPSLTFRPITYKDSIVVGDKSRMIRGFSVPGLKILWESATQQPFRQAPLKISPERFIVTSSKNLLFCLDRKTGKPVWQKQFSGTIASLGYGKIITCIHGYTDTQNPKWKLTAIDPEDGETLWTFDSYVGPEAPIFTQGICILSDKDGKVIIVDQDSGALVYKGAVDGVRVIDVLSDKLIMLASGGSRIICMSLMTGNSWTTTLQASFLDVASYNGRLIIADKNGLRCVDENTGALIWRKQLNDVYNAYPFYKGIFVVYKDSFFARTTHGSYIEAMTGVSRWISHGKGLFYKPVIFGQGYLLPSYLGQIRLMPKVTKTTTKSSIMPATKANSQMKVNFWKTPKVKTKELPPVDKSDPVSNSIKESGWGN